jgi:hypothetical protein
MQGIERQGEANVATSERANGEGIGRRRFLQLMAVGVGAAIAGPALAAQPLRKKKTTKVVFRLSTHRHRCCKACKGHGANRFYRTKRAANKGRAHKGCNCAIVTQTISRDLAKQYFKGRKKVYDLRSEVPV